jgi:hypothetical protein
MLSALLLGTGLLLASLLFFTVAIALTVSMMSRVIRTGYSGENFWKNVGIMIVITLVMAAAHLMEIALWATAFRASSEILTFEKAFYFSAQNYTTLGYGDIVLSDRWRLLGPVEAVNGLLLFGLSTAAMFAALSRLVSGASAPDSQGYPRRAESVSQGDTCGGSHAQIVSFSQARDVECPFAPLRDSDDGLGGAGPRRHCRVGGADRESRGNAVPIVWLKAPKRECTIASPRGGSRRSPVPHL